MPYIDQFVDCREFSDARKVIVLEEEKSKYRAENPLGKKVTVYRIDGCILQEGDGKKCDYLLVDDQTLHFIELKGRNLEDAIQQLMNTVHLLMPRLQADYTAAYAKIVLKKTAPQAAKASTRQWEKLKKLMQQYRGDAFRQNTPFQENL
jgi:hypothetical protein